MDGGRLGEWITLMQLIFSLHTHLWAVVTFDYTESKFKEPVLNLGQADAGKIWLQLKCRGIIKNSITFQDVEDTSFFDWWEEH